MQNLILNTRYQPRGLLVLFFLEMWERFSYWGIQSILVLYLVKNFLFSDENSYSLFGAYTALTYATSLISGIIADRILGFSRSIILGAILIIIGNIVLSLPNQEFIYLGLSLIVGGTGMVKPNSTSQLGTLYDKNDSRRDNGFTFFYVGTNIGGILGPIVYGFIATQYGWHTAFIISAVGVFIGLVVYIFYGSLFKQSGIENQLTCWLIILFYLVLVGLFWVLLLYPQWVGRLLNLIGLLALIGLLLFSYQGNGHDRRSIAAIFLMVCFCLLFFACLFQCSTSLVLFIERFADRTLLGKVIPAETFVSLQPFFVVLFAPVITQLWSSLKSYEPSAPKKIVIGLFFASISFICFMLATSEATEVQKAGLIWILMGNILLSIGELCIAPPTLAAITALAPVKLRSTLIGLFYLALAFAGYLASLIAKLTTSLVTGTHFKTPIHYFNAYKSIFYIALFVSIVAYIISHYGHKTYSALTQNR